MLLAAAALSIGATIHYGRLGLVLSHYDARAHLVVARRVIDNLTPGWKQFGGMWLPFPHLLTFLPLQIDFFYRTGAFAVALSMVCFVLTAVQIDRFVSLLGGGALASGAALATFGLNANVLYLQSTAMTEPLYFLLAMGTVTAATAWASAASGPAAEAHLRTASRWATLASLTRYEGWLMSAALAGIVALLAMADRTAPSPGGPPAWSLRLRAAVSACRSFATAPAIAVVLFMLYSRISTGSFLTIAGFFEANNPARGDWLAAARQLYSEGVEQVLPPLLVKAAILGFAGAVGVGLVRGRWRSPLPTLALAASAALSVYAFHRGHPFRVRYAIPMVVAAAASIGAAAAVARPVATILLAVVLLTATPFTPPPPMVVEASVDGPARAARQTIATYLLAHRNGEKILASLGSLSHFVHELAASGFDVRDVVHEGTWLLWPAALADPARHVGWVMMEEDAEGGDVLAARRAEHPEFLRDFRLVMRRGGVALYERRASDAVPQTAERPRH